jgi:membrane protein
MSYWLIPNTRVSPIAAIAGGIFAGLVWDVSKDLFVLYLLSFPNVRNLLPILGVLPIFLLWLYTTWLVVFLGLEFTYVLQHYSPLAGRLYHSDEALDLNPRHLLAALYELGRHLNEGDPLTTVAQLMRATQQDEYQVHALLDHCESKGWVVASEPHAVYQLARPAEQIALSEVLVSPVTLLPGAPTSIHPGPLEEFWRSHHDSATSALPLKTLRELLCMSSGPADKARQAVGRQADAP